ncbi:MAG: septum formation inhibitor Maf [Microbacteriaceae bacterium]|nr:septum formation inhibitor Maf [Microbacteriaceae bacterium]
MRLYLASTSPARLATLRSAGVEPVVVPSKVDEAVALSEAGSLSPSETVALLARLKAEAVAASEFDDSGFILGCDSVFELDGVIYGKPHTAEVARQRWELQRGKLGILHTGHWLIPANSPVGSGRGEVSSTEVQFANPTDSELDAYIATGEPLEVAGAFTIDSLGGPFISSVIGDPHTVVGLSLATLRNLLAGFGVDWHELWKDR